MENIKLSNHFTLEEFCNLKKFPDNKPTMQHVVNMAYGCLMLLEPTRQVVAPIIINSGFRNSLVNALVVVSRTRSTYWAKPLTSAPKTLSSPCTLSTSSVLVNTPTNS